MTTRDPKPSWTECRAGFAADGSLRDIYVENTDLSDWERLIQWLRSSSFVISFSGDGGQIPLPRTASEVFALSGKASSILTIHVGPLRINSHFFSDDEIEMDLDPRDVIDEGSFGWLLSFVEDLGDALGRDVIVTEENFKTGVLLRYRAEARQFERERSA